jgi:light-harvesting complex II chlorophyll a/b binding protein 5
VKEIKNGRLAMIAMLGIFVQGLVTDEGPATNWAKHVANPFGYNFVTLTSVERLPTL